MADRSDPDSVQYASGFMVSAISRPGQGRRLPCVVDISAGEHPTVYVSGGRRSLGIAPPVLVALYGASVAPIAR